MKADDLRFDSDFTHSDLFKYILLEYRIQIYTSLLNCFVIPRYLTIAGRMLLEQAFAQGMQRVLKRSAFKQPNALTIPCSSALPRIFY